MRTGDPRFQTFPAETGVEQLKWYIYHTASGAISIQDLIADFRVLHETIERQGPPEYASYDEGRAIWDVLWAVEFCSADITQEENPEDWYIPEEVLMIVKKAAEMLHQSAAQTTPPTP